jgi:hypothetical protein
VLEALNRSMTADLVGSVGSGSEDAFHAPKIRPRSNLVRVWSVVMDVEVEVKLFSNNWS